MLTRPTEHMHVRYVQARGLSHGHTVYGPDKNLGKRAPADSNSSHSHRYLVELRVYAGPSPFAEDRAAALSAFRLAFLFASIRAARADSSSVVTAASGKPAVSVSWTPAVPCGSADP